MDGILVINNKRISIKFDIDKLTVQQEPERISIGGETDEEFATKRNSLGRWLLGLPKKRKASPVFFQGRMPVPDPLLITFGDDGIDFFHKWMHRMEKTDFLIVTESKYGTIKLCGSFVVVYADNSDISSADNYVEVMYDCWEANVE